MRLTPVLLLAALGAGAAPAVASDGVDRAALREIARAARTGAYQGRDRGPEQTERFTRKVKLGRDGRVSIGNISGNIVVTGGSGDEVTIDGVKRARGDQSQLAEVRIVVDDRPGRVDIRTEYDSNRFTRHNNNNNTVSVDYTITVPGGASVDAKSISGNIKVTGVRGAVRGESVSGDVTASDTPRIETAKSVSGNVSVSGIQNDGDVSASSVSGSVTAKGIKAHALDVGSVSGDLMVSDVTCDRLNAKSVSGGFEYNGSVARGGVYDVNLHSGTVRFVLVNPTGFELTANTFSGNIRSDLPLTIDGNRDTNRDRDRNNGRRSAVNNRSMRATFGDGSATLTLHTFSGDIVITKR